MFISIMQKYRCKQELLALTCTRHECHHRVLPSIKGDSMLRTIGCADGRWCQCAVRANRGSREASWQVVASHIVDVLRSHPAIAVVIAVSLRCRNAFEPPTRSVRPMRKPVAARVDATRIMTALHRRASPIRDVAELHACFVVRLELAVNRHVACKWRWNPWHVKPCSGR